MDATINPSDPYAVEWEEGLGDDGCDGHDDTDDNCAEPSSKGAAAAAADGPPLTKSQIRRAQVRRAQIQHRKRKADYLKQLEVDVNTLRELITEAEKETRSLMQDNENIRQRLGLGLGTGTGFTSGGGATAGTADAAAGDHGLLPSSVSVSVSQAPLPDMSALQLAAPDTTTSSTDLPSWDSLFNDFEIMDSMHNLNDVNVSLVHDEIVGSPVYQISAMSSVSLPAPAQHPAFPASAPSSDPEAPFWSSMDAALASTANPVHTAEQVARVGPIIRQITLEEVHRVVNFILSLEHVCWSHAGHQYSSPPQGWFAHGHAMMASSLLLRRAPDTIHQAIYEKYFSEYAETAESAGAAAGTGTDGASHRDNFNLSWTAPDVSLQSLYGLACSLNPSVDHELAPVQAWFEMAARYPLPVLLRQDVLDMLKAAFAPVVHCLYFGSVVDRPVFETVVDTMLNPMVQSMVF